MVWGKLAGSDFDLFCLGVHDFLNNFSFFLLYLLILHDFTIFYNDCSSLSHQFAAPSAAMAV